MVKCTHQSSMTEFTHPAALNDWIRTSPQSLILHVRPEPLTLQVWRMAPWVIAKYWGYYLMELSRFYTIQWRRFPTVAMRDIGWLYIQLMILTATPPSITSCHLPHPCPPTPATSPYPACHSHPCTCCLKHCNASLIGPRPPIVLL